MELCLEENFVTVILLRVLQILCNREFEKHLSKIYYMWEDKL